MANAQHCQPSTAVVSVRPAGAQGAAEPAAPRHPRPPNPAQGCGAPGTGACATHCCPATATTTTCAAPARAPYQGRCTVPGNRIDQIVDSGFAGDGGIVAADVLHHRGMPLRRVARDAGTGPPRDAR